MTVLKSNERLRGNILKCGRGTGLKGIMCVDLSMFSCPSLLSFGLLTYITSV